MKRTFALTAAALTLGLGGGVATATTAQAAPSQPLSNNWVWSLPNGTVMGSCTAGYHPVWNAIPNYQTAYYKYNHDGKTDYGYTWDQIQELINNGTIKDPTQFEYDFKNSGNPESTVGETAPAGILAEGDCLLNGYTLPTGPFNGDVPGHAVPKPTPTKPTPTPTKPTPVQMVTRTFQVDTYGWKRSSYYGNKVLGLDNDGRLNFREDSFVWKTRAGRQHTSSVHEFVKVTLPKTATNAQWIAGINRATKIAGNDVTTTAKAGATKAASGKVTMAWEVRPGSWTTSKGGAAQVFFARS